MPVDFSTAVISSSSSPVEEQREYLEEEEEGDERFGSETIREFLASLQSPSKEERRDWVAKEEEKKNNQENRENEERENMKQPNGPLCLLHHHRQREELPHDGEKLKVIKKKEEGEGTREAEVFFSLKMKTDESPTPSVKAKEEQEEADREDGEEKKKEEERKATEGEKDRLFSPVVQPEGRMWSMRALYESFLVLERIEWMARRAQSGVERNEEDEDSELHNGPASQEKRKEKESSTQKENMRLGEGCHVDEKIKREVKNDGEKKEKERAEDFNGGDEEEIRRARGVEKSCPGVHTPHQEHTAGVVGNYDTPLTKEEEAEVCRQKEVLAPRIFTALVERSVDLIVDAFRLLGTSSVVLSFNGGKDAIATLHLYRAALAKFYIDEYRKRRQEEEKKKKKFTQQISSSYREEEQTRGINDIRTTSSSASPPPPSSSSSSPPPPLCSSSSSSSSSCNDNKDEESGESSSAFCESCLFCHYEKAKDQHELHEGSPLPLYYLLTAHQEARLACKDIEHPVNRKVNSSSISLTGGEEEKQEEKDRREQQEDDRGMLSSRMKILQAQASAFYSDLVRDFSSSSSHQSCRRKAPGASVLQESRHLWEDAKNEERKGEEEEKEEEEADGMKEEAFRGFCRHVEKHLKVVLPMERPRALFFHGGEKEFTDVARLTEDFARRYEFNLHICRCGLKEGMEAYLAQHALLKPLGFVLVSHSSSNSIRRSATSHSTNRNCSASDSHRNRSRSRSALNRSRSSSDDGGGNCSRATRRRTREGDPGVLNLHDLPPLQVSSRWLPPFLRVHPLAGFEYGHVWKLLDQLGSAYTPLYDEGYSSIGNKEDTRRNPYLYSPSKQAYLPARYLRLWKHERAGRGVHTPQEEKDKEKER
ncbi:phosphoadenosine phosphosulfate reductase family protein [Cystoisospora suis]|uniref:FAD synthase n=1 Tax=Cystoisospora suis TaxID=483139 RepID=A0A2C6L250_9APIC|nr:phosphoadenosine phosphosulfate reductase family protein [Cystoisospora suis]